MPLGLGVHQMVYSTSEKIVVMRMMLVVPICCYPMVDKPVIYIVGRGRTS